MKRDAVAFLNSWPEDSGGWQRHMMVVDGRRVFERVSSGMVWLDAEDWVRVYDQIRKG